ERYGLDTVRFFLLREFPFGSDGSYSYDAVVRRKNADLSNNQGNLAQRSLSMVYKNLDAQVPQPDEMTDNDQNTLAEAAQLWGTWHKHFETQAVYRALNAARKVLDDTSSYFADQQPWVLRRSAAARMTTAWWVTLEVVRRIGLPIKALMP